MPYGSVLSKSSAKRPQIVSKSSLARLFSSCRRVLDDLPDEKERMARAIHKLRVVVHAFVHPVALLDAKDAPGTCESEIFMGIWRGKESKRTDKGAIGANKVR